jgi:hypothetical protein
VWNKRKGKSMSEKLCCKSVSDSTGYHFTRCNRPAKLIARSSDGSEKYLCGIHARRARRLVARGFSAAKLIELKP